MTPSADPWRWIPDRLPWFDSVVRAAAAWTPTVRTSCAPDDVTSAIADVAASSPDALYHPCLSALTHVPADGRCEREVALLAWLALRGGLRGDLVLEEPTWCWTDAGGTLLASGRHPLTAVAREMAASSMPGPAFDPWCTLLGYSHPGSIPATGLPPTDQEDVVRRCTLVGLRAVATLRGLMPDVHEWVAAHVKVVVPLATDGSEARSSSAPDLPGLVLAGAPSELALLELLVHEAAHHVLYLEEASGPLVDPSDSRLFTSPLRPDQRPLRGILLAYHALAFMCAFYADLHRAARGRQMADAGDVVNLLRLAHEARATLSAGASGLTDDGAALVERTDGVLRHAS